MYQTVNGSTSPIIFDLLEYNKYLSKGYYILNYEIQFEYDESGDFGTITPSSFHNQMEYEYTDIADA